jgi:hypothetical protein
MASKAAKIRARNRSDMLVLAGRWSLKVSIFRQLSAAASGACYRVDRQSGNGPS